MKPDIAFRVRQNEVVFCKIRLKNNGFKAWPPTSFLYQIASSEFPVLKFNKISLKVGSCKSLYFRFLEPLICAPDSLGTFTYHFQMGTEKEIMFGEIIKITLIVTDDNEEL